ncbi:hypothetical protein D3C85_1547010 [compost metagenome]
MDLIAIKFHHNTKLLAALFLLIQPVNNRILYDWLQNKINRLTVVGRLVDLINDIELIVIMHDQLNIQVCLNIADFIPYTNEMVAFV